MWQNGIQENQSNFALEQDHDTFLSYNHIRSDNNLASIFCCHLHMKGQLPIGHVWETAMCQNRVCVGLALDRVDM